MLVLMDDAQGLRSLSGVGITIDTARAYRRYSGRAGVYCPRCADLRLGALVMRAPDDRALRDLSLRFSDCGGAGELQVRPPVPSYGGARWGIRA